MPSNSKLTAEQKDVRKHLIRMLPAGSMLAMSATGITFLTIPSGAVNEVYSAVASPDEQKIRREVGEYHALVRFDQNCASVVVPAFMDAHFLARRLTARMNWKQTRRGMGPGPTNSVTTK